MANTSTRSTFLLASLVCILAFLPATSDAAGESKCSGSGQQYYCPNCDGIYVDDCLTQCDGYLNTDPSHGLCYTRKLFNNHDTSDNPNEHYHFLWRDIVGTIVWFLAAGVATACGVGGGGIYVPLGIILLGFAPKPASGLSQASIFGASLGGLILNIQAHHPNMKIRDGPCVRDEDGKIVLPDADEEEDEEQIGGDILRYSVHSGRRYYTRPLIDYDMALFLAPMEMAGAVMGTLIQAVMPNWLYLLLASVILSFTSYKTYTKFFAARTKEREERERLKEKEERREQKKSESKAADAAAEEEVGGEEEKGATTVVDKDKDNGDSSAPNSNGTTSDSSSPKEDVEEGEEVTVDAFVQEDANGNDADADGGVVADDARKEQAKGTLEVENGGAAAEDEKDANGLGGAGSVHCSDDDFKENGIGGQATKDLRRQYLEEDARQYPREKLIAFLVLWIGLIIITFLKGGKGVESLVGITCESPWYGVLVACQFLWTIGFATVYAYRLLKRQKAKDAVCYPYQPTDVMWDRKKVRFYSTFTFLAGVVAGLIGIGGGMVLGPLMLVMGIHPRVSTATTATMIVLTSSSVAIMFVTAGLVPWSYAVYFFCVCLCGAFIGKKYIDGYVKKTGKASLLIFILATIICLATIGCLVIVFTALARNNWCFDGFKKFCYVSTEDGTCAGTRMMTFVEDQLFSQ